MNGYSIDTLIIKENIDEINLIKVALRKQNLENKITIIKDGESALNYLHKRKGYENALTPDLILLDLVLPKIAGIQVLKEIKLDEKLRTIPVIVFATSDSKADILESYNLYANAFISKPIDFEKFELLLNQLNDFWANTASLPPKD